MTSTGKIKTLDSKDDTALEASSDHKAINALALDKYGSRMITGGVEGILKLWDFSAGQGVGLHPVRELQPLEHHAVNAVSFNCNDTLVLCVASDAKARIFDMNLSQRPVEETVKGDQYIRTPENTKGHTHMLSCGSFHPLDASKFMTGSYDCTVRLWDINTKKVGMDQNIPHLNCFKCIDQRNICGGTGMYVSSANYSSDGKQIVAGCSDGSVQLFHEKYKYGKPLSVARIVGMGEVTDVQFCSNDTQVISRSFDGVIRIFDLRFLKKSDPITKFDNFPTDRSFCNFSIGPNNSSIVAGTCPGGELVQLSMSSDSFEISSRKKFPTPGIIRTIIHPLTGEIFAASSDGNIFILYDKLDGTSSPPQSGVGLAIPPDNVPISSYKRTTQSSDTSRPVDYNVYSYDDLLESGKYRENRMGEIRAIRQQTVAPSRKFFQPHDDSANTPNVREELEKRLGYGSSSSSRPDVPVSDMQKYLLSFDEKFAGDEPSWVGRAYKRTQPEPVLDYSDVQGSADNLLKKVKQYCPRCGLKMCTCGYMSRREE